MQLASSIGSLLPAGLDLTNGVGAVGFGEAVDMDDIHAQGGHLADDRRTRRGAGRGHGEGPARRSSRGMVGQGDQDGRGAR